jgi:TPR repeat protein
MAATDLGSALAVGAFGLSKDLKEAERYLRIGIEGGDVSAQRNLGLVLLDIEGRLDEAVR